MTSSVSILATGSELLDGRVLDTNSNFVARALADLGLKLKRVLTVDDDLDELISGLQQLSQVSEIIITSGGLGPTSDDLTREMVAKFFGVGIAEYPEARKHLEDFYQRRARVLDIANLKQALLPIGSEMIPNENGTAPGFMMTAVINGDQNQLTGSKGRVTVCSLSGVPREFHQMFQDTVLPLIRARLSATTPIHKRTFKIFGLPESLVGKVVSDCQLSSNVSVSYRAAFPEVHVVLKAPVTIDLKPAAETVRGAINNRARGAIYTEDSTVGFFSRIQELLIQRKATVSSAESCTGGLLASFLTETPGSSEVFNGAVVSYSNQVKRDVLQVPEQLLSAFGAVSAETVSAMASQIRLMMNTTYGLAISGIAGPEGGSAEKPVGTVWIGLSGPKGNICERRINYINDRSSIRTYASYVALDLLRRELEGLELSDGYPILKI